MECKIKFKGKTITEKEAKAYFDDLISKRGTKSGLSKKEVAEYKRILNVSSYKAANDVQKFIIHQLVTHHLENKPVGETHYINKSGKKMMRATNAMGMFPEFEFTGDDSKFEINRKWGTAINEIFDIAITDGDITEYNNPIISESVKIKIYNYFKKYDFGKNSVVLTQLRLSSESLTRDGKKFKDKKGNEYDGVAGTADIVVVDESGQIHVLDLKSGINPTDGPYKKVKGGVEYTNSYDKRVRPDKASKKESHGAQMSIYYYMLKNLGFSMRKENPIGIIPIHINSLAGDEIIDVVFEPLINNHDIDSRFSSLDTTNDSAKIENILIKIKKNLGERLKKAQEEGKPTFFINNLIEAINGVEMAVGIGNFVEEMKKTMLGNSYYKGHRDRLNDLIEMYNNTDDINKKQNYIAQIESIKEVVDSLLESSILKDLKTVILTGDFSDNSMLSDVREILDAMDTMKIKYDEIIIEMTIDILSKQVTPDMIENMVKSVKDMEESVKKLQKKQDAKPTKRRERLIEEKLKMIKSEKERLSMDSDYNIDFKASLRRDIEKGGYKDTDMINRLFTPATSIDNTFLAPFVLTIKKAFEDVRKKTIEETRRANAKFESFLKGRSLIANPPEELYNDFITTITINDKEVLSLRTLIDWDLYLKSKKEASQEAIKKFGKDTPNYKLFMESWYAENTQLRPEDDIVINGIVVVDGINTIKNKKKNELSTKAYEEWLKLNDGNPYDFMMPKISKYQDTKFQKIKDDEFFTYLSDLFNRGQKLLPERKNDYEKQILPFIGKKSLDRFREQGIKSGQPLQYIRQEIRETFSLTEEDYNASNYSANMEEGKSIPIRFYNRSNMMEAKDTTKDIYFSILKFYDEAQKYSVQSKYKVMGDNLLGYVKQNKPAVTDHQGVRVLSKVAKLVGLENTLDDYIKKSNDNVAAMLEMFIDTTIYGRRKMNETIRLGLFNKNIDLGKIADSIMSFASGTQIALNPLLYVANTMQGNVANLVDNAAGGIFESAKVWAQAKKIYYYDSGLGGIADTFVPNARTKIGLMIEEYDPIQGDYYNDFGKKLTRSEANRLFSTSTAYALSHIAEHQIQVQGMIAQMLKTKVKQVINGVETEINMFDAMEEVNGELKWKEGVIPIDKNRFMNIMHAKNKRLHGIYNDFDIIEMDRYSVTRLIMFYRKFLAPGFLYRWKSRSFDYELGDYTQGIYRVFYKKLLGETSELLRSLSGLDSTLTPFEQQAARRALMEHIILGLTGALTMILSSLREGADDEEKWKYSYLLYFTMRLNAEISIYGGITDPRTPGMPNINEMASPFRTPTAALSSMQKVFRLYTYAVSDLFSLILGEDILRYKSSTGPFEKGTSKTYAALVKVLGFNKNFTNIDEAIEQLVLVRGTD